MDRFTHGIMVINPKDVQEGEDYPVLHFVGYWNEPSEADIYELMNEFRDDETLGLKDTLNDIELLPATPECLKFYNDMLEKENQEDL